MNLNQLKKLGVLGAAACALIFAPVAASAQLDKCTKDITKNAAKATADVQKELAKCVDGWIKTDLKGKGQLKQAEKCQAGLIKIGLGSGDISGDPKSKLGKAFDKVKGGFPGGAKAKCTDDDLDAMGILNTNVFSTGDVGARLSVMAAFARAWSVQNAVNGATAEALANAADQRCNDDETVACAVDGDCATGTCGVAACPECADMAAPLNGPPTNRVSAGPCWSGYCDSQPSSSFITHQLVSGTPTGVTLDLRGNNTSEYCHVPEILADGIAIVSGPSKGLQGTFAPTLPLAICLEQQRAQGYIATVASADLPNLDIAVCADVDAVSTDDCLGFVNCTAQAGAPDSKVCRDVTLNISVGGSVAGASAALNLQRIQATLNVLGDPDPCNAGSTPLAAPATPGANLLATGDSSGTFFDVGSGTSAGTFTLTTASLVGATFDPARALVGDLDGTLTGVSAIVATDPAVAAIVGHTLTEISTVCAGPTFP